MNPRKLAVVLLALSMLAGCAAPESGPTTTSVAIASTTIAPTTTTDAAPADSEPAPTTTTTTQPATTTTTVPLPPLEGLEIAPITDDLSQAVVALPWDGGLIVAQRNGLVVFVDDGDVREEPVVDLRDIVNSNGIEQGLLGMAPHPDVEANGRMFLYYYFGEATTRLVEMRFDGDSITIDPATEQVMLSFDQPTVRHNAGMIQFDPEGLLYLSLGEGGRASEHAQDPSTLLSSILRLDIDAASPYAVPADNPFVEGGGAPEVWAYGLRNPWRFSIDPVDRLMYIGDVGHERYEEVDIVPIDDGGGYNFGWLRMEGSACFQSGCDADAEGLTLPVLEYTHDEGCSVTGGFVYRGQAIPELFGHYVYSDWCGGWIRSFRYVDGSVEDATEWLEDVGQVNAFGVDADGELLVMTWDGRLGRIVPVRADDSPDP